MPSQLPSLRHIAMPDIAQFSTLPLLKIKTDGDVRIWRTTRGYQDYGLFLRRLNESVVGYFLPWSSPSISETTRSIVTLLNTLDGWIDDIPPLSTPQRFGNIAFRTWGKRLEEQADTVLSALLPSEYTAAIPHLKPYFLTSFGSFVRMDYGSGHETSFMLFLLCLTLIRFVEPNPTQERDIVLIVFVRYLTLCWRLQDVYKLEPAGSHGVWGLDDYTFIPYIFGSAQLRDQQEIPVSAILRTPLPATNLYFMSIMRIFDVKSGPFHEHSSQLYSIATGVATWSKVNSGLFKMYEAEVLGKRVVVQHIPLGGLLDWNDEDTQDPSHISLQADARRAGSSFIDSPTALPSAGGSTPAPWASAADMPPLGLLTGTARLPTAPSSHVAHIPGALPHRSGPISPARMPLGPMASSIRRPSPDPHHRGRMGDRRS